MNRRNSNLVVTTACRPALENLNKAAESTDWPPIPNLAGTISDKGVFSQLRLGLCCLRIKSAQFWGHLKFKSAHLKSPNFP